MRAVTCAPLLLATLLGCPGSEPEPGPTPDRDWFDFLCDDEGCTPPAGWEPVGDLHEAFVIAEGHAPEGEPLYFVAITFHAPDVAVPPEDLAPDRLDWSYHFWSGEIFGGTEIGLDLATHEVHVEPDLDLYDAFVLTEAEVLEAVEVDAAEAFAIFAGLDDAFPVTEGLLKDHTYGGSFQDPAWSIWGFATGEAVTLDAGTGEVREDP